MPESQMDRDLRDTILEYFIKYQIERISSDNLAIAIHCTEGQVTKTIAEINDYNDWIRVGDGGGDSRHGYMLRIPEVPAIKDFLANGGFTRLGKESEERDQLRTVKELIELEKMQLEIQGLKRAVFDSKKTRQISRAAIWISLAALIFEICKSFF